MFLLRFGHFYAFPFEKTAEKLLPQKETVQLEKEGIAWARKNC